MKFSRWFLTGLATVGAAGLSTSSFAQTPSSLYTFGGTGNTQSWIRSFGASNTSATLDNSVAGALRITETSAAAGGSQAFSDGFNVVREGSASSGGLDLTGLSFLRWTFGHNGSSAVNVQFYVQATTGSTYVALGSDLAVNPGISSYDVPLAGLTDAQRLYVRTMGINIRDHAGQGNLTWTIEDLSSVGTPLLTRDLVTFDTGTAEGGLNGAIVNFDGTSVQGNGGQNQTGLSHNSNGSGSLQWTDLGGGNGGAISWGNGSAWNGNTFNNRTTDLSGYTHMIVRMSATDATGGGGTLGVQGFFQKNNFAFQSAEGGVGKNLTIDGQFHDLVFSLDGLTNMSTVDQTGINLFAHSQNLVINLDNVRFVTVPEPGTMAALGLGALALVRRRIRSKR